MKNAVGKYLALASMLATVAWFFWNPAGWTFNWEPVAVFFGTLIVYIGFDVREHRGVALVSEQLSPPPRPHPVDIELFARLRELLPSTGVIAFLREHDFLGAFDRDDIRPLNEFIREWDNAEHRYIDPELEVLRHALYQSVHRLCNLIAKYTSPTRMGRQSVRSDHHEYDPDREQRYHREAQEINECADQVVRSHQELFTRAREKLGAHDT